MTTISAKIIRHSCADNRPDLISMLLRYPRCIHSEFMTHRVFSRNASSSRAIPVKRLIQDVLDDPFIPLHWGKNQKGMQAHGQNDALLSWSSPDRYLHMEVPREDAWLRARDHAVNIARAYDEAGYHKQLVNRLLEPFAHINVLVTATEWGNFFELRDHEDAEPHIQILARAMKDAIAQSEPRYLEVGQWHLPFVTQMEEDMLEVMDLIRISVARCARTSYLTHDGQVPNVAQDLDLYQRLVGGRPLHASPSEHQGSPGPLEDLYGNFHGWHQYRKMLERVHA